MLLFDIFAFFILLGFLNGCDQPRKGFIKRKNKCTYELGCEYDDDFFLSQSSCYESLRNQNPCFIKPCRNGGICTQITKQPFYKCYCAGTGYFGFNCTKSCNEQRSVQDTFDCIVI